MDNAFSKLIKWGLTLLVVLGVAYVASNMILARVPGNALKTPARQDLNEMALQGDEAGLPAGAYVRIQTNRLIGPFASLETRRSVNDTEWSASTIYYYFLILDDDTVMAVCAGAKGGGAAIDEIAARNMEAGQFDPEGETIEIRGRLQPMTDGELTALYDEGIKEYYVVAPDDQASVRYMVLDANENFDLFYLIVVLATALIAAALILIWRALRRGKEPPIRPRALG